MMTVVCRPCRPQPSNVFHLPSLESLRPNLYCSSCVAAYRPTHSPKSKGKEMWVTNYSTLPRNTEITIIHGRKHLCACFNAKSLQSLNVNPSLPVFHNISNSTAHISLLLGPFWKRWHIQLRLTTAVRKATHNEKVWTFRRLTVHSFLLSWYLKNIHEGWK